MQGRPSRHSAISIRPLWYASRLKIRPNRNERHRVNIKRAVNIGPPADRVCAGQQRPCRTQPRTGSQRHVIVAFRSVPEAITRLVSKATLAMPCAPRARPCLVIASHARSRHGLGGRTGKQPAQGIVSYDRRFRDMPHIYMACPLWTVRLAYVRRHAFDRGREPP